MPSPQRPEAQTLSRGERVLRCCLFVATVVAPRLSFRSLHSRWSVGMTAWCKWVGMPSPQRQEAQALSRGERGTEVVSLRF